MIPIKTTLYYFRSRELLLQVCTLFPPHTNWHLMLAAVWLFPPFFLDKIKWNQWEFGWNAKIINTVLNDDNDPFEFRYFAHTYFCTQFLRFKFLEFNMCYNTRTLFSYNWIFQGTVHYENGICIISLFIGDTALGFELYILLIYYYSLLLNISTLLFSSASCVILGNYENICTTQYIN